MTLVEYQRDMYIYFWAYYYYIWICVFLAFLYREGLHKYMFNDNDSVKKRSSSTFVSDADKSLTPYGKLSWNCNKNDDYVLHVVSSM